MTINIKVICAGWVDGSGWSYTAELDGFTVGSLDQLHEASVDYVREAAESPTYNASDVQYRFYAGDDETPRVKLWESDYIVTDDNETDDDTGTKKHISTFRVWKGSGTLRSGESYDVRGLNAETVMRREFGRSKKLSLMYDNNDTAQVAYALDDGNYSIMGYIREV